MSAVTPEEAEILVRAAEAGYFRERVGAAGLGDRISERLAPLASALLGRPVSAEEFFDADGIPGHRSLYEVFWDDFDRSKP